MQKVKLKSRSVASQQPPRLAHDKLPRLPRFWMLRDSPIFMLLRNLIQICLLPVLCPTLAWPHKPSSSSSCSALMLILFRFSLSKRFPSSLFSIKPSLIYTDQELRKQGQDRSGDADVENGLEDTGRGKGKLGRSERVAWTCVHHQMWSG